MDIPDTYLKILGIWIIWLTELPLPSQIDFMIPFPAEARCELVYLRLQLRNDIPGKPRCVPRFVSENDLSISPKSGGNLGEPHFFPLNSKV